MHVLRAKQATPPVESKQPKSKAAKKKALTLQASASINANDTLVSCACHTTLTPPPLPPANLCNQTGGPDVLMLLAEEHHCLHVL